MLRVRPFRDSAAAKAYYQSSLSKEDYYSEGKKIAGIWHGKAAAKMGLEGEVKTRQFGALADNLHPVSGKKLTPRMRKDRIVAFDLNFHPPKSVSLLYAFTGQEEILKAFRHAVATAMSEIERHAETRVRKGGKNENRRTGNLAWAEYVHFTTRPEGGIPDPHLHAHNLVFNVTFDEIEQRWKAANAYQAHCIAPYAEAVFHAQLAANLSKEGFKIEKTRKGWEVSGVPRTTIDKYSRRTAHIEAEAAKRGLTTAKEKDGLGAKTRDGKRKGVSHSDLLKAWSVRLAEDEQKVFQKILFERGHHAAPKSGVGDAVNYAIEHCFSRRSVVTHNELLREALKVGVGEVTLKQAWAEVNRRPLLFKKAGDDYVVTTRSALQEERNLVAKYREGKGMFRPLAPDHEIECDFLSDEQRAAVKSVLESYDQVTAIQGSAGVGKTTLVKEIALAVEARERRFIALAPSSGAARDTLQSEGFSGATTVADFLDKEELQEDAEGQVVWVDEAGMLSVADLNRILEAVGPRTRVLLTGDIKQHGPVQRGEAFKVLQQFGGMSPAEVRTVRRQQDATYRKAVEAISEGKLQSGFASLEALGAIHEIGEDGERYQALAKAYVAECKGKTRPFVVSPTHLEGRMATDAIRDQLRQEKRLGKERNFTCWQPLHWEAEKSRAEFYEPGMGIVFDQNARGVTRGERFTVSEISKEGRVKVAGENGKSLELNLEDRKKFSVFEKVDIAVAKGDRLRLTRNLRSTDERRLNNGNLYTVTGFTREGEIKLHTGAVLKASDPFFSYGYCTTSYTAQSKSTDPVFIAQSRYSERASSLEQWYVSVSRGKTKISVFTDDRARLYQSVGISSQRLSALEVFEPIGDKQRKPRKMKGSSKKPQDSNADWRSKVGLVTAKPKGVDWSDYVASKRQVETNVLKSKDDSWTKHIEKQRQPSKVAAVNKGDRLKGLYQAARRKSAGERLKTAKEGTKDERVFTVDPKGNVRTPEQQKKKQEMRTKGEPVLKSTPAQKEHTANKKRTEKQAPAKEKKPVVKQPVIVVKK